MKDAHKTLAAVALKGPESGVSRGFVPQTQLFGATAAVFRYDAVSRVMATGVVRWRKSPHIEYSDDFGIIATESTVQDALRDFAALGDFHGFELRAA